MYIIASNTQIDNQKGKHVKQKHTIAPQAQPPYLRIFDKLFKAVNKVGAIEWIATNTYDSALSQPLVSCLEHSLEV